MANPFVLSPDQYKRDLNILKGYYEQNAHFLHLMTDQPKERCMGFLKKTLSSGGTFPLHDPEMLILRQESPGNRVKDESTLISYIREVTETERILSPTMTCYENPKVLQSPSAKFVEKGIQERKKAKNEMFQAQVDGDEVLEGIKNAEQNAKKIGINSLSGMHGFTGNILYVKSGHPSLTSMCRAATGYGNSSNERLLAGSRHYWSATIAIANMMSLITSQDHEEFEDAMVQWGMVYPTVEQTVECIRRSLEMYNRKESQMQKVEDVIVKMSPIERAIVVYTGDMYHIAKYNDSVVRGFMDKVVRYDPSQDDRVVEDPHAILKSKTFDDETRALATYLNADITLGENFDSLRDKGKVDVLLTVAKTAYNIVDTVNEYFTFFRTFLTPKTLPPTVANIRDILRRSVLASDTDSTIFTTQEWVTWYTGSDKRTKEGDGVWYTMTYISCQCIIHVLAKLSANIGVIPEQINRLSMKNEYAFPVFTLTNRAKHYYAFMSAREGNVYESYRHEIKGVALRSSIVPPVVIKGAKDLMTDVMTRADNNEQYTLEELYQIVWRYEQDIYESIKKGEHTYLKSGQIQGSYANMETSNYRHYVMWNEVFAAKYGAIDHPPYSTITVPLAINNKTDMRAWMDHIDTVDVEFGRRMRDYCAKHNRDQIRTLMLPHSVLSGIGMPDEVMGMIDIRRLTYGILESFYMILESLGVFQVDSKYVRLISDIYTPPESVSSMPLPSEANSTIDLDDLFDNDDDDDIDYADYF